MDSFHIAANEIPVLICRGLVVLRNPSNQQIADCLGFNESVDQTKMRDLVVIGAGPSGLAAAVYGASEGLDVLLLETSSLGGQAGSSSRIENYLGFPTGISGQELAGRAYVQAQKFGAHMLIAKATQLICDRKPYVIEVENGTRIPARTIVIASLHAKTCRALRVRAYITARLLWKHSYVTEKRLLWLVEETQPVRQPCFWLKLRSACTCSSDQPV